VSELNLLMVEQRDSEEIRVVVGYVGSRTDSPCRRDDRERRRADVQSCAAIHCSERRIGSISFTLLAEFRFDRETFSKIRSARERIVTWTAEALEAAVANAHAIRCSNDFAISGYDTA
jgi:hypothetical protein